MEEGSGRGEREMEKGRLDMTSWCMYAHETNGTRYLGSTTPPTLGSPLSGALWGFPTPWTGTASLAYTTLTRHTLTSILPFRKCTRETKSSTLHDTPRLLQSNRLVAKGKGLNLCQGKSLCLSSCVTSISLGLGTRSEGAECSVQTQR